MKFILVAFIVPLTCNFSVSPVSVPIPTLPLSSITILSVSNFVPSVVVANVILPGMSSLPTFEVAETPSLIALAVIY